MRGIVLENYRLVFGKDNILEMRWDSENDTWVRVESYRFKTEREESGYFAL